MLREIRPAILVLVLLTAITGLAYPLAMTAIAGVIFPKQAQGSLIEKDGKVIGSALIGQEFKEDKYFHGRPSATVAPDPNDSSKTVPAPYNAANSGGSNLGPTSKALNDRVKEDVEKLKAENPPASVPVDLVTTSGSGLDPDISPDAVVDTQNGVPFFASLVTSAPTVVLVHHCHREQWPVAGRLLGRFGWFLESKVAPRVHRGAPYVTVSEASKRDLVALGVDGHQIGRAHV